MIYKIILQELEGIKEVVPFCFHLTLLKAVQDCTIFVSKFHVTVMFSKSLKFFEQVFIC